MGTPREDALRGTRVIAVHRSLLDAPPTVELPLSKLREGAARFASNPSHARATFFDWVLLDDADGEIRAALARTALPLLAEVLVDARGRLAVVPGALVVGAQAPADLPGLLADFDLAPALSLCPCGRSVLARMVKPGDVFAVAEGLSEDPRTSWALPDPTVQVTSGSAGSGDPGAPLPPHVRELFVDRAWCLSVGAGVTVGVIDDGFDIRHPAFAGGAISSDSGAFQYTGVAQPEFRAGPGQLGLARHGTMVAGLIGARATATSQFCGVAPKCRLLLHSLSHSSSPGLWLAAYHHARMAGASIVCSSLGLDLSHSDTVTSYDAFEHSLTCGRAGAPSPPLVCWAAPSGVFRPIELDVTTLLDGVLAVGMTTVADAAGSHSGGAALDLLAPGQDIPSTVPGGLYAAASGTSFAAPLVAGIAALVLARNPSLGRADLELLMVRAADRVRPREAAYDCCGHSRRYGRGLVNAWKAVAWAR